MNENARCTEPASQSNARGARTPPRRRVYRAPVAGATTPDRQAGLGRGRGTPARVAHERSAAADPRRGVLEVVVPPAPHDDRSESARATDPDPRRRSAAVPAVLLAGRAGARRWRLAGWPRLGARRPGGDGDDVQSAARGGHGADRAVHAAHGHLRTATSSTTQGAMPEYRERRQGRHHRQVRRRPSTRRGRHRRAAGRAGRGRPVRRGRSPPASPASTTTPPPSSSPAPSATPTRSRARPSSRSRSRSASRSTWSRSTASGCVDDFDPVTTDELPPSPTGQR